MIYRIVAIALWPVFWFVFPLRLRASLLVVVKGEVLVVTHRLGYGQWSLPGGGVKLGELPIRAAVREVQEELGVEIDPKDLKMLNEQFETTSAYGIISRHKFYLYQPAKKPGITPNREIKDYRWASIHDEQLGNDVQQALKRAKMV